MSKSRYSGPGFASLIAVVAAAPGLAMPFIADDWINLAAVSERLPLRTPFGYFRPLYLASYWAELRLWGMSPVPFHLTNLVLMAACAALVVIVVRRFTGDPVLGFASGALFALHPFHVENVAWIAARGDSASAVLALVAVLAYERWSRTERGIAVAAIVALEAALLFKESVALLPAMIVVLRVARTRSRLGREEWLRGILPLAGIVAIHFLVLRRIALGDGGQDPLRTLGFGWIARGVDFFSAAVLPMNAERIESRPWLFAALALAVVGALVLLARRHLAGRAYEAGAGVLLFVAALAPSLLSFQERYFLFPSVVSCTILAFLLLRGPKRVAPLLWALVVVIWAGSVGSHWQGWLEAGRASERLIGGLTEASRRENVREIVVANLPYRVAGAPVAGDLNSAVMLNGGGAVQVRAATALNLRTASASGIEGEIGAAVRQSESGVELPIRMDAGVFSGIFLPLSRPPNTIHDAGYATLAYDDRGGVVVRIPRVEDGSRAAYVWYGGRLSPLF